MLETQPEIRIVSANSDHIALILGFIRKLAEYEKLSHEVVADEKQLLYYLFGARPVAEVALAFLGERAVGFALFFTSFSTFVGRPGIYLEDLFVEPETRGRGIGKALLRHLARLVVDRGYGRLEWSVLNWNQPSIDFYRSLGAVPLDAWTGYRLTGGGLHALAASEP
jgi:GNAT superfamily N-acetyltransferase